MKFKHQVQNMDLFSNCQKETIDTILDVARILEVKKGTILLDVRENISYIYIQMSGKSIAYNYTNYGRRKILFVYGKGSLLSGDVFNYRPSSMIYETIEESTILAISLEDFERMMKSDFQFVKNIIIAQEQKLNRLGRQLKNTASGISVEKKLLSKLWKLAKDFGIKTNAGLEIDMNLSITFLADMLGVPRETASRACSALVQEGLIHIQDKKFTIQNPEKLAHMYKNERKKQKK